MPPKYVARKRSAGAVEWCTIVCHIHTHTYTLFSPSTPFDCCDYFDDDVERFVPCAHCAPADASQRPSPETLTLSFTLSAYIYLLLSLFLGCANRCTSWQKKSLAKTRQRSSCQCQATNTPANTLKSISPASESESESESSSSLSRLTVYTLFFFSLAQELICAACLDDADAILVLISLVFLLHCWAWPETGVMSFSVIFFGILNFTFVLGISI